MLSKTAITVVKLAKVIKRKNSAPHRRPPLMFYEHVRQRDEDQRRAGVRLHAEGKAGREDDHARHHGDKRIQSADAHGFARQTLVPGHVAAENLHAADAKTERKERLIMAAIIT